MLKIDAAALADLSVRRLEVAPGAVFIVKPWSNAYSIAGRHAVAALGPEASLAEREVEYVAAIAEQAVVGWDGFGDMDDEPLTFQPGLVAPIVRGVHAVYSGFDRLYVAANLVPVTEKNVSSGSRNGTSAAGRNTAKGAPSSKARPVKSVPTKSKSRARSRAR